TRGGRGRPFAMSLSALFEFFHGLVCIGRNQITTFTTNALEHTLGNVFLVQLSIFPAIAVAKGDAKREQEQILEHVGWWTEDADASVSACAHVSCYASRRTMFACGNAAEGRNCAASGTGSNDAGGVTAFAVRAAHQSSNCDGTSPSERS